MYPSYIAKNIDDLLDEAPPYIQELLESDEIGKTVVVLGKIYKIPVDAYVNLSNIISFILIGALKPEDVTRALTELVKVTPEDAVKLAQDLDKSILEKARIKILGKAPTEMVELTFKEGRSAEDLRKEILDTTKRESALVKEQSSSPLPKDTAAPAPAETPVPPAVAEVPPSATETAEKTNLAGSRSQLLEQLRVLDDIPDDEEITARLAKIQEQIASIDKKDSSLLEPKIPLQNFMFGEKAADLVEPDTRPATYSKAPTKYNVDPYREQVEE